MTGRKALWWRTTAAHADLRVWLGAFNGGRVIADRPGLKAGDLHENRDLKPTTDLRSVLKGVLKDHLRADDRVLAETVFPGSKSVKPLAGLVD